jgi:hypothetical protein
LKPFDLLICLCVLSRARRAGARPIVWPPFCQEGSLPSHDPQYPADQLIVVCIPPNWNGQLVVYAHGYVPRKRRSLCQSTGDLTMAFVPDWCFWLRLRHQQLPQNSCPSSRRKDLNDLVNFVKHQVHPARCSVHRRASEGGGRDAADRHYPDKYDGAWACGADRRAWINA